MKNQTDKICLEALKRNAYCIDDIREQKEEFCLIAVNIFADSIKYINPEFLTEQICLQAIIKDAKILKYIPKEFQTEKICIESVSQNGLNLEYVLIKTKTICKKAINTTPDSVMFLNAKDSFNNMLSESELIELNIMAIKKDNKVFQLVEQFEKVCLEALRINGLNLKHVNKQTIEMCEVAVKQNKKALKYINKSIFSKEDVLV